MHVYTTGLMGKSTDNSTLDDAADMKDKISSSDIRNTSIVAKCAEVGAIEWARRSDPEVEPYTIGLTGGIACGKSTVSKRIAALFNVPIVDCDKLGHKVRCGGWGPLSQSGSILNQALHGFLPTDRLTAADDVPQPPTPDPRLT